MTDNLFTWMFSSLGSGLGCGQWPTPGGQLLTGGSPRYAIYQTADARYLAVAAIEDRFWRRLCELVGLAPRAALDGFPKDVPLPGFDPARHVIENVVPENSLGS